MRQATRALLTFLALVSVVTALENGQCSVEEEYGSHPQAYNRYTSNRCTSTMAWIRDNEAIVNECTYHWVISQEQNHNAGTVQMGVEGRSRDGFVFLSEYRIRLQGGTAQVKRNELAIMYNEAMQICFFTNNEFDHVLCPMGVLVGHEREDLMILETLATFPPRETWSDVFLDAIILLMETITVKVRAYKSDVTTILDLEPL